MDDEFVLAQSFQSAWSRDYVTNHRASFLISDVLNPLGDSTRGRLHSPLYTLIKLVLLQDEYVSLLTVFWLCLIPVVVYGLGL